MEVYGDEARLGIPTPDHATLNQGSHLKIKMNQIQ